MARYTSVASLVQPYLLQSLEISNEDIAIYHMKIDDKDSHKVPKENLKKPASGFIVQTFKDRPIVYIYNPISHIYLVDTKKQENMLLLHTIFAVLYIVLFLLYLGLRISLKSFIRLENKFKKLQTGDISLLKLDSNYDEINLITTSYNRAILKIKYILQTKDMFSKIFMHEIKMPIAKGLLYLKLPPSKNTHENLKKLFIEINNQLDEFVVLERVVLLAEKIEPKSFYVSDIINKAYEKIVHKKRYNIVKQKCKSAKIEGDESLWIICFKNLIENGLKYSSDNQLTIKCDKKSLVFINKGDKLPIDLNTNITNWKINKIKRHKSSTGYGFGLFIIKNVITTNGYSLRYEYKDGLVILSFYKS